MQMPWMTRRTQVIDNNPHSRIRPQVVYIPVRIRSRVASVPSLRQQQYWIVPIRYKRTVIDSPGNMARSVDSNGNVHGDRSVSISGCDGIHWYSFRQRVVETRRRSVYLGDRVNTRGGTVLCIFIVDDCESKGLVGGLRASAGCDV